MYYVFKNADGIGFAHESIATGVPAGSILISDEQHDEYFAKNQQGFDIVDCQWIYTPPPPPTADEVKAAALAALDAEYQPQFTELQLAWAAASMDGNATLADAIKADRTALKAEYAAKRQVIESGN